jgi:hypothetical protein
MSITEGAPAPVGPVVIPAEQPEEVVDGVVYAGETSSHPIPLSFKERLKQQRRALEEDTTFTLPIPYYKDLYARYRVVGFEEMRAIGLRVEKEATDQLSGEKLTAAETLAEACEALLERTGEDSDGKPILEPVTNEQGHGYRWGAPAARDLFDVAVLDGTAARDAIMRIFPVPRDMLLMSHFEDFLAEGMGYLPQIEEILRGESPGALAATTSGSSRPRR